MKQPASAVPKGRLITLSFLLIFTFCYILFFSESKAVPPEKPLSTFPNTIGEWIGVENHFDQEIYDALGVDDSVLFDYHISGEKPVHLYIGYYQSQREGDIIHSPKNCLPGSGWDIVTTSTETLNVPGEARNSVRIVKLLIQKNAQQQVVLYWYQARGRFVASEYIERIYMIWDSLTRNRTDEAFVRLMAPVGTKGESYTTTYLKMFARQAIPVLSEYLPD